MSALLDHELPGVDAPHRAVANDRRIVSSRDAVGHCRVRLVGGTVLPAGIAVRAVPFVSRDPRAPKISPVHVHGDAA